MVRDILRNKRLEVILWTPTIACALAMIIGGLLIVVSRWTSDQSGHVGAQTWVLWAVLGGAAVLLLSANAIRNQRNSALPIVAVILFSRAGSAAGDVKRQMESDFVGQHMVSPDIPFSLDLAIVAATGGLVCSALTLVAQFIEPRRRRRGRPGSAVAAG